MIFILMQVWWNDEENDCPIASLLDTHRAVPRLCSMFYGAWRLVLIWHHPNSRRLPQVVRLLFGIRVGCSHRIQVNQSRGKRLVAGIYQDV